MEIPRSEPCLSETSSIISVSEAAPSLNTSMDSPKEGKQQEGQDRNQEELTNPDLVLDLSLSSRDLEQGSRPELNLINSFEMGSSQNHSEIPQGNEGEPRVMVKTVRKSCNVKTPQNHMRVLEGSHRSTFLSLSVGSFPTTYIS
ncbi:unnamed protein product, partial [Vitis vinifera]